MSDTQYAVLSGNIARDGRRGSSRREVFCAYPMSPSTGVLHWMTAHAHDAGIVVRQVEDEIGVINMAIGAARAGVRAMCATSGGGFALMTEGLGMSAMVETPVVVIDVQRAGPSTGVPTKTEQGHLWQMLGAGFGDFPRLIAAPTDIADVSNSFPKCTTWEKHLNTAKAARCFNEAASPRSRKETRHAYLPESICRFNEAASSRSRKAPRRHRSRRVAHRFNEAASSRSRKEVKSLAEKIGKSKASMRPRALARGKQRP